MLLTLSFPQIRVSLRTRGTLFSAPTVAQAPFVHKFKHLPPTLTMSTHTKTDGRQVEKAIGTHNGTFHCDEALACFLLKQTSLYRNATIVRSRDPRVLDECDIVVDVGGIYDDSQQRYDHHQRNFHGEFGHGFTTKLSSAGLIYKHYGKEIIASRFQLPSDDPVVKLLWLKLYQEFIEAIDGIDNGVLQYQNDAPARYKIRTDLSSRVAWLNPAWNESADSSKVDALFTKASNTTGEEFLNRLDYYANAWLPARDIVVHAMSARTSVHPSGRIVVFEKFAPWKEHLFDIEREQNVAEAETPLYAVYPDETASNWRIQAVPVSPDSFESRKALPQAWRGIRDDALSQLTGIPGCIFVHASGFIGGNTTKDGVMAMAQAALGLA